MNGESAYSKRVQSKPNVVAQYCGDGPLTCGGLKVGIAEMAGIGDMVGIDITTQERKQTHKWQ